MRLLSTLLLSLIFVGVYSQDKLTMMDIYELEEVPENFGFYVHGRGHSVAHESRQLMYGWMDTHLKPADATATRLIGSGPSSSDKRD